MMPRRPEKFIVILNESDGFVAVDDSTNNEYTEWFRTFDAAYEWLINEEFGLPFERFFEDWEIEDLFFEFPEFPG